MEKMEYLGFDPSTSSLLTTHASDCANTLKVWPHRPTHPRFRVPHPEHPTSTARTTVKFGDQPPITVFTWNCVEMQRDFTRYSYYAEVSSERTNLSPFTKDYRGLALKCDFTLYGAREGTRESKTKQKHKTKKTKSNKII